MTPVAFLIVGSPHFRVAVIDAEEAAEKSALCGGVIEPLMKCSDALAVVKAAHEKVAALQLEIQRMRDENAARMAAVVDQAFGVIPCAPPRSSSSLP